ncbi:MAG: LemA family protein [Solirubrobacteraceae bacterium]|nr:LemA family protein [Patulibacter sp.]
MIALVVVLVVVSFVGLGVLLTYNRLVSLRLACESSWGQIDVTLKQRHDLVPGLVQAVQGYATHERTTLESVTEARAAAVAADAAPAAERVSAEATLGTQIGVLRGTAEAYPDLMASASFRALQDQLVRVEDQLQITRRVYNDTVETYNTAVQRVPSNLVASVFGFRRHEFFAADIASRAAPTASFGAQGRA